MTGDGNGTDSQRETHGDPAGLLTTREAAERLGIGRQTLERWRAAGGGPSFVRLGRRSVRYRREDVDDFVRERLSRAVPAQDRG